MPIVHRKECEGGWQRCALKHGENLAGLDGSHLCIVVSIWFGTECSRYAYMISVKCELGAR